MKKIDAGTRTLQLIEVSCKKDSHPIQAKIAPVINKAIKKLEKSKLIAIKIGPNFIVTKFIPDASSNIVANIDPSLKVVSLSYSIDNEISMISIPISTKIDITIHCVYVWTVIQSFKVVIAGDLSFFATSTGRDGHNHCRCNYCDSSYHSWNDVTSPTPTKMTLPLLYYYADMYTKSKVPKKINTKGVVMKPLLDVDPQSYVVPLLHLSIGIVNKLWSSLLLFLDEFVEKLKFT